MKVMVSTPGMALAFEIAWRGEPSPRSFVLSTAPGTTAMSWETPARPLAASVTLSVCGPAAANVALTVCLPKSVGVNG